MKGDKDKVIKFLPHNIFTLFVSFFVFFTGKINYCINVAVGSSVKTSFISNKKLNSKLNPYYRTLRPLDVDVTFLRKLTYFVLFICFWWTSFRKFPAYFTISNEIFFTLAYISIFPIYTISVDIAISRFARIC